MRDGERLPFEARVRTVHPLTLLLSLALVPLLAAACQAPDEADPPSEADQVAHAHAADELGEVHFPTSCSEAAQSELDHGLLMLHHMMYPQAREAFEAASRSEPDCAMAHWGIAMSRFQPFWGSAEIEAGRAAALEAVRLEPPTERERLHARAALAFFEAPEASYGERIRAWEAALAELHEAFPDDLEAATLFSLAHLSVDPADRGRQDRAGDILERAYRAMPEHPGAIHYAIHVHDVDALADDGVRFARAYEDLAPSIPHALHMPSHIYVRTGSWEEVIDWNRRSADAALEYPAGDYLSLHYPHALDYLMYGHLQKGQDEAAREVRDELLAREGYEPHLASAYALAAIPARWYVERRDWEGAAALEPRTPPEFDWDAYPAAEAMTWFARGLGAAKTGAADEAAEAEARLLALEARLREAGDGYWARRGEVQRRSVAAWRALAEGDEARAVEEMTAAAELEGGMEKHAITPGELQPAHELLGDLLVEVGRPAEALEAYERSLETWPRRYHTLLGAARAAEAAGLEERAVAHYRALAELAASADSDREGAREARERVRGG